VVLEGPEDEVHSRVAILWKPTQSVGVETNLLDFPTNREEEVMPIEEADTFSGPDQGVPKVFMVNMAQIFSYCLRLSNLSTSKNLSNGLMIC
jgi:hypothetical protein